MLFQWWLLPVLEPGADLYVQSYRTYFRHGAGGTQCLVTSHHVRCLVLFQYSVLKYHCLKP